MLRDSQRVFYQQPDYQRGATVVFWISKCVEIRKNTIGEA
ncbi:uncharacterized protein METZ01_LOCUS228006 [marine metagenome]|uniref:Uncharacterized protein n=1 Tax=marine metagenome TaxID=408172 RepID=A0A382GJS4_9ZZZZ